MPNSVVLSKKDFFLSMIYKFGTGCTNATLEDIFGGKEKTFSTQISKILNAAIVFFRGALKMTTLTECRDIRNELQKKSYPLVNTIWKADCIDTPIASQNANYYTHKKQCSSNHAIR